MTQAVSLGLITLISLALMISPNGARAQEDICDLEPTAPIVGKASWYGPNFHGRRTATGKIFNQHDPRMAACIGSFTFASDRKRTCVEVTNLRNRKRLNVECQDTGAFCKKYGRVIDLSYQGAVELGYARQGTALVRVKPISCKKLKRKL